MNFLKRIISLKKNQEKISWKLIGSQKPEVLLLGHSHRTTMGLAIKNLNTKKEIAVLMESSGPYRIPESEYWDFAITNKSDSLRSVIIIWQGHLSLIDFLFKSEQSYFLVNENNILEARAKGDTQPNSLVFEKDLINTFYSNFAKDGLIDIVKSYKKSNLNVILLSSPPPKDSIYINKVLKNESYFNKKYNEYFENKDDSNMDPILDEAFRVRIWKLMQVALKNLASEENVKFITIPEEFMNDEGILLDKYYFGDVSHANEKYAEDLWNILIKNEAL